MEESCGAVLYTVLHQCAHYILVTACSDGSCGFPKGHREAEEREEDTALRELWEETSVHASLCPGFRETLAYTMPNGRLKTVIYFLAVCEGQTPHPNAAFEPHQILVLPYAAARAALTHESARVLLDRAHAAVLCRLARTETAQSQEAHF